MAVQLELLCFLEEEINKGYHFNGYLVELTGKVKKQSTFKTKEYKIIETFDNFEYLDDPKFQTVKRSVLFLQSGKMFKNVILLPKLPNRVLYSSFTNELQKQYGDVLKEFDYVSYQDVTEDKKNAFTSIFFKIDEFNNCLDKFINKNISFDEIIYLPSLYTRLVEKEMTYGIYYVNKMVKAFVATKKECIRDLTLFGYDNLDKVEENLENIMKLIKYKVLYDKRINHIDNVLTNIINFVIEKDPLISSDLAIVNYPIYDFCVEAYYRDGNSIVNLPTRKIIKDEK